MKEVAYVLVAISKEGWDAKVRPAVYDKTNQQFKIGKGKPKYCTALMRIYSDANKQHAWTVCEKTNVGAAIELLKEENISNIDRCLTYYKQLWAAANDNI